MMKKTETTKQNKRRPAGRKRKMLERIVSMLCLVLLLTVTIISDVSVAAKGGRLIIGSVQSDKDKKEKESEAASESDKSTEAESQSESTSETELTTESEAGDTVTGVMVEITAEEVNLRTEASTNADVLASATTGDRFPWVETTNDGEYDWYQIDHEGNVAYVRSDMAVIVGEEVQTEAESESETETESESESEAEATVLTYKKDGDYEIAVSYGPEANIPEGAELKVTEIKEGTDAYDTYLSRSLNVLAEENEDINSAEELTVSFARYFDISFMADGKEFEPEEAVDVKITYAQPIEVADDETVNTVHFPETQKEPEVLDTDTQTNKAGDVKEVVFTQESFSVTGTVVTGTNAYSLEAGNYAIASASSGTVSVYNGTSQGVAGAVAGTTLTIEDATSTSGLTYSVSQNYYNSIISVNGQSYSISYANNNAYYLSYTKPSGRNTKTYYLTYDSSGWNTSNTNRSAVALIKDVQVKAEPQNITFVYYPQNSLGGASDSQKAENINTVKFTVNLLDADGKITTLVPGTTEIPANIPDRFTTGPETTVAELLSHISVNGYTLEDGYAFFFWDGNAAISGGMDLSAAGAHSVKTFKNFTVRSDVYKTESNWPYSGSGHLYGTIGYTMTDIGSDQILSRQDWNANVDPSQTHWAYEYGGVLHIVLKPMTEDLKYKTFFFNYAESGDKVVATTLCDMEYINNMWQGKLKMTTKEVEVALTPPTADYVFDGWYDAQDADGNGTGEKIKGGELQYSDKTVYARWVAKGESKPDDPFIKVQKTVSGISLADLPDGFAINVYKDADRTELVATLTKNDAEQSGDTLTWIINDVATGTYYIEETGAAVGGLTVTPSVADGTAAEDGLITVRTLSPAITVDSVTEITTNSSTTFDITDGYICASLTKNRGYFIWTEKTLSASEREALVAAITAKGSGQFGSGKVTVNNTKFYSSADKLESGINIDNAYIRVSNNKLEFSEKSIWNQVCTGTYTVDKAIDAEIAITNTYTTSLEITKEWEPDTFVLDTTTVKAAVYEGANFIESVELSKAENWKATVRGLDPEKTYQVVELDKDGTSIDENDDVYIDGQSYKVTYSDVEPQTDKTLKATITNTLNTSSLEIIKVDSKDEDTTLRGAEFKLEKRISGEGEPEEYKEIGKKTTGEDGKVTFEGLENGTYRLTEVKAPDGYMISGAPQNITVDYKNKEKSSDKITITVKNAEIYSLPATGGIGTYWFTLIGVSILMTAFLLLITNLKKRRI